MTCKIFFISFIAISKLTNSEKQNFSDTKIKNLNSKHLDDSFFSG